MKVSEIKANGLDAAGVRIEEVYAKYDPVYAVYRTTERVLIHFSDDTKQEKSQRAALASLSPIRGEINGLIDGWRTSKKPALYSRSRRLERRVADALVVALEDDMADAILVLQAIKTDVLDERQSIGRFQYLSVASITMGALLLSILVLHTVWAIGFRPGYYPDDRLLLLSAAIGAVGAFFSVAIAIRTRSVQTDLRLRDNAADAILRIVIGLIAAPVLIALLRSNIIVVSFGDNKLQNLSLDNKIWPETVVVAFLAGFLERLVGDLLAKAGTGFAVRPASPSETMTGAKPAPVATSGGGGGEAAGPPPRGNDPVDPDAPDGCTSDLPLASGAGTGDSDLPVTVGGQA